jgi:amino acid adenylation domain-containing protein
MLQASFPVSSLCGYLEASARRFGDRVAAVDSDGSTLSYRDLNDRADRIAGFLVAQGVGPGDHVGLVQPKSVAGLCAIFGIMKARAAYVPVDCTAPAERIRAILEDCQVRAVFADPRRATLVPSAATIVVTATGSEEAPSDLPYNAVAWQEVVRHDPYQDDATSRRGDDLAYILYTSGSTGVPKGVMLSHFNALSFVEWCSSVFTPNEHDRFSSHAPFHFDLSILDIYLPLKHGSSVFLISEEVGKNPRDLAAFIASNRLTVWYSTPSILSLVAEFGGLDRFDFSHLRLVLFAGEVFPVRHLRNLTRLWPSPAFFNLYGPTETNVCTFARIPLPVPEDRTEPYPIGWPCSHCLALVLDEAGEPVSPGKEGLLYIAGPSVFHGYWGRPQESAVTFLEGGGRPWYNTGDVVKQNPMDGFVYVGRRDRMVKRRGYRIELGDIESALYRHERIREAAVVAVPDVESGVKILAYVATPRDARPSVVDMKIFCSQALPAYMSPDVFIFRDVLPRTSTNKVDYQALTLASAAGTERAGSSKG